MPWYRRRCGNCAATGVPHVRVLCGTCLPGDLPESLADASECMTAGRLRECLIFFMDLGGAWGADLGESKRVLLEVRPGSVKAGPCVRH